MDYETIRHYYISYINMIKTAKYRGYKMPENIDCGLESTQEEFTNLYGKLSVEDMKKKISKIIFDTREISNTKLPLKIQVVSPPTMALIWHLEYKMGIGIRDVVNKIEELNVKKAMIVVDGGITPGCREMLGNIRKTKSIIIDIWTLKESMVYVPDHVLVPKHEICSLVEKRALLKSYGIRPKNAKAQLPKMKHDATMTKYLGANKGNLIKITRVSDTDPDLLIKTYRIVV